jgi:hypothetical protein
VRIARIKRPKLGGWIVALWSLEEGTYVGVEMFILPGSKEAVSRQLAAVLGQFERSGARGILQDLSDLCKQYDVAINPEWTLYVLQQPVR